MIVRYFKSTAPFQRRTVIWLSPEWEIDKSLEKLKDKRWAFNVIGIDIGPIALKKSGMDAASYYHTKIAEVLENHGEKALICMDDFPDGAKALYPYLRDAYNTMLRTARSVCSTPTPGTVIRSRPCRATSTLFFSQGHSRTGV